MGSTVGVAVGLGLTLGLAVSCGVPVGLAVGLTEGEGEGEVLGLIVGVTGGGAVGLAEGLGDEPPPPPHAATTEISTSAITIRAQKLNGFISMVSYPISLNLKQCRGLRGYFRHSRKARQGTCKQVGLGGLVSQIWRECVVKVNGALTLRDCARGLNR